MVIDARFCRTLTKKQLRQVLANPNIDLDNPVGKIEEVSQFYLKSRVKALIDSKELVINGKVITWEQWAEKVIIPASWVEVILNAIL